MADNSRIINRVFTRGVINDLLQKGTSEVFDIVVRRFISDPESKTHGEIISEIYAYMGKEKRNEYYYMNTLLNKLLVGIHSVNTTTVLSKIRIGQAIADFIMINGEGKIYAMEVKSELDNFDRLSFQVENYFKAFGKVSVLSSKNDFGKVQKILAKFGNMGESVGIYVLSDNDTIFNKAYIREPRLYGERLNHTCLFKILRKREYENILNSYFGEMPNVPPVFYFRACLEQFMQIPIVKAQDLSFAELKKRNRIEKTAFESIQAELKSVIYFSEMSKKLPDLNSFLQTAYRR